MNSSLPTSLFHLKTPSSSSLTPPSLLHLNLTTLKRHLPSSLKLAVRVSSVNHSPNDAHHKQQPTLRNLRNLVKLVAFIGATASMAAKFSAFPALAETPPTLTEQMPTTVEEEEEAAKVQNSNKNGPPTPLSELLESNTEAIQSLKSLLQEKLDNGEDGEALNILKRLASAQPSEIEWKFLMARLLSEMGQNNDAREVFEEILVVNPLSFEVLFENALLMDRCGEGDAVIRRLEEALGIAEQDNKVREARDVRLIMAQIQFLQKNVEEALRIYDHLAKEDPGDFRPYFCRGMIYSLLDRNEEAKEQFAKYHELSPKKFEVEGYLRSPLSRMKLFGSNEEN